MVSVAPVDLQSANTARRILEILAMPSVQESVRIYVMVNFKQCAAISSGCGHEGISLSVRHRAIAQNVDLENFSNVGVFLALHCMVSHVDSALASQLAKLSRDPSD